MRAHRSVFRKLISVVLCLLVVLIPLTGTVSAAQAEEIESGTYLVDARLSCYISAMGGIDFGNGLLSGMKVQIDEDGNATATLGFTASSVTIYSVTCNTFVDATKSRPGYYSNGNIVSASYTIGSATALNPDGKAVRYVDSMTFPVSRNVSTYYLYLYINSSVMGVQFCDGSGSGASNTPGVETPYQAKLTIDWGTLAEGERQDRSARVVYQAEWGYIVNIPATIHINPERIGSYQVTLERITADEEAYVTVATAEKGVLRNGNDTLEFVSELESEPLKAAGDTLNGTITVTDEPVNIGTYTGTIDFIISYFAGN